MTEAELMYLARNILCQFSVMPDIENCQRVVAVMREAVESERAACEAAMSALVDKGTREHSWQYINGYGQAIEDAKNAISARKAKP